MAKKIVRSTVAVGSMTMLSRLMGFIRDVICAMVFGASPTFDAFVVAFKIPNFFRRLFGEGAFAQAFVPVLADYRSQKSEEQTREFVSHIAGSLGLVLMLMVILAEVAAPVIIMIFAPGFFHDPIRYHYTTHLLHIIFPYLLFIGLTAFSGAVLNTFNRFLVPAFTPVFLNLAMIIAAWFVAPHFAKPIYILAYGVLVGGVCQLALQLPFLLKLHILKWPRINFKDPGVKQVMRLMVPALFGVSVVQISLLVDNFFASFLQGGSISWLYYSDRFTYLPLSVIGVAIATVILPNLSRQYASDSKEQYALTLNWALRSALLMGVPAALGLAMLAGPILTLLVHHTAHFKGAFNQYDVMMTRKSLIAFAIGLPAFMLIKVLASGFYSRKNIKTPVKIAAISVVANIIFNVCLIAPLAHAGIALATSLAAVLNAALLLIVLIRQKIFIVMKGWALFLLRLISATSLMALFLYWRTPAIEAWLAQSLLLRVGHLIEIISVSLLAYAVMLWFVGMRKKDLEAPVIE